MESKINQMRKSRRKSGREMKKSTMTNKQLSEFIEHAMKITESELAFIQRGKIHGA